MFASLVVNAHDFIDPVVGALEVVLPVLVYFVAVVFAVGFGIGFVLRLMGRR